MRRFDWFMGCAALVLSGGGILDDWAHFHGLVDESFFTPWHGIMYGMMAFYGTIFGVLFAINIRRGHRWRDALPPGYLLSFAGVIIFLIAGMLDLGWHAIFGIESDTAAFVSPTHVLLCAGGVLAATGPLRSAWLTLAPSVSRGWRVLGPMILSTSAALAALAMFTQFASPLNNTLATKAIVETAGGAIFNAQSFGIAEVIVQSLVMMSVVLVLLRTWSLPFGAMMVLIGLPSVAQIIMSDQYWLALGVFGSGLAADLILLRLHPPIAAGRLYVFAATVPALYQASIMLIVGLTAGLGWPASLVTGSVVYAAATGLLLAFLLEWPLTRRLDGDRQTAARLERLRWTFVDFRERLPAALHPEKRG